MIPWIYFCSMWSTYLSHFLVEQLNDTGFWKSKILNLKCRVYPPFSRIFPLSMAKKWRPLANFAFKTLRTLRFKKQLNDPGFWKYKLWCKRVLWMRGIRVYRTICITLIVLNVHFGPIFNSQSNFIKILLRLHFLQVVRWL